MSPTSSRPSNASRRPSTPSGPAVITRLSDLRHVKVNTGFLEMTGHTRDAVIGAQRLRIRRTGRCAQPRPCHLASERGRHHPADGGVPRPARWRLTFRDRGGPARRDGRRALHAVHFRGSRTAPEGRDGPAPERGTLRQGLPAHPGADHAGAPRRLHGDRDQRGLHRVFSVMVGDAVVGRSPAETGLLVAEATRARFEETVRRTGFVLGQEVCLRHQDGSERDCLASAERVEIGEENFRAPRSCRTSPSASVASGSCSRHRDGHGRHLLVQPRADREARQSAPARCSGRRRSQTDPHGEGAPDPQSDLLGLDDDAIARRLNLSRNTVRNHGAALYASLGVHKRAEAVIWGRENGFPPARIWSVKPGILVFPHYE